MVSVRRGVRRLAVKWGLGLTLALPAIAVAVACGLFSYEPFEIPDAYRAPVSTSTAAGLVLRYTGVTGYELSDGQTVVLLDPVHTRPSMWSFLTERVHPDEAALARLYPRADFILVNHAHHDHGVDAPAIARRTGAVVVGSRSVANLARSRGLPESQIREVEGGEELRLGSFVVRVGVAEHSALLGVRNFMRGTISPDAGQMFAWQYVQDGTLIYHLRSGQQTLLFHPAASYAGQRLPPADTIIFGLAGEGLSREALTQIQQHTQPELLLPTHYDNFFQAKELGMTWLPTIDFDDAREILDATRSELPWWLLDYDQSVRLPNPQRGAGSDS